jgi:hypothetical protein
LISAEEEKRFHEILSNLDLFMYQPVSAAYGGNSRNLGTEFLLTHLKDSSRAVSFPVAHFTGYNPETVHLLRKNGYKDSLSDGFYNCHDLNILKAYHHGMSWQECLSYIQKSAIYTSEVLETNVADSLSRLRERERETDVKISDFIEKNWRKQHLFFTYNHCANSLLLHEANQILHLLGLPSLDPSIPGSWELLGDIRLFVYPDVRKHFDLSFAEEVMRIFGRTFTLDHAVRAYFDYYSTHHELVQENIDFYSRSSDATLSWIASYWPVPSPKLQSSLQEKDAQIRNLTPSSEGKSRRINNLLSEFHTIRSSIAWTVARKLHTYINIVLPIGTKRRHFVRQALKAGVSLISR